MQYCSILLSAKTFSQDEEQILVNVKDRGRLWKVNNDVQNTLSITEKMFTHATKNLVFKLNEVKLIFEAVQNINCDPILIICVRMQKVWWMKNQCKLVRTICGTFYQGMITFIFCDVKERCKVKYSEIEMHSLRIELMKSSKQ